MSNSMLDCLYEPGIQRAGASIHICSFRLAGFVPNREEGPE